MPFFAASMLDVLEHDVEAGLGRDVGDARAHHARAEHTDLGDRRLADAVGPRAAAELMVLQVEEERLDHVLGDLAGDQLREVAALDAAGGVEVDLRALDRGGQDGPRSRHRRTLELLASAAQGTTAGSPASAGAGRGAAGHLVALGVPRLGVRVGVGLDPRLGGGYQFLDRREHFVDQAGLLGLRRLEPGALRQHVHERVLDAEHPHAAGDAAARRAAGRASPRGSRRRHPSRRRRCGGGTPAQISRPPPSAAPLMAATTGLPSVSSARRSRLMPSTSSKNSPAFSGPAWIMVLRSPPAKKVFFALVMTTPVIESFSATRRSTVLCIDSLIVLVHHVGRPGRVVQRQGDDAVGILVPLDGVVCHGLKPSR